MIEDLKVELLFSHHEIPVASMNRAVKLIHNWMNCNDKDIILIDIENY